MNVILIFIKQYNAFLNTYLIYKEFLSVLILQIHLSRQQQIIFNKNADETELKNILKNAEIILTA